jgi:protein SCO1/2
VTRSFGAAFVVCASLLVATGAQAQMTGVPQQGYLAAPGVPSQSMPRPLLEIGFDQKINEQLPLDATFRDETGQEIALSSLYGKRPVVLGFVYYECPMLCTQVLNAITATVSTLQFNAGQDFDLVLISFDPRETPKQAAAKKAEYVARYKRPGTESGWHFLTGDEAQIKRVTQAAGYRYTWDEETQQFAHPTGIIVTTPEGRNARYLFGIEYGPRDLKFAIVEASQGRVGSVVDNLLLYCYHYDPMTGRYGVYIMRTLRIAGVATILSIGTFIVVMVRREKSQQTPAA